MNDKKNKFVEFFKKNKVVLVVMLVLTLISISIYVSFAFYTDKSTMNLINGSVGYFENPDLNINFMVQDRDSKGNALDTYSAIWTAPSYNYIYNSSKSYCTNGATFIKSEDNYFSVESTEKSKCYFYYDAASDGVSSDITLILMRKEPSAENADANGYILANEYSLYGLYNLGLGYNNDDSYCTNEALMTYDVNSNTLDIKTDSVTTCTVYFDEENYVEIKPLLVDKILLNDGNYETVEEAKSNIESKVYTWGTAITKDAGLYATIDQTGNNSYFFVGSTEDNYVEFADMFWRIVRIDGEGNIKLIYAGTTVDATNSNTEIQTSKFNSSTSSTVYTGYVYSDNELRGTSEDSTIKEVVEDWYKTNIENKGYSDNVAETLYCIDRDTYTRSGLSGDYTYTSIGETISTSVHYYGASKRLYGDFMPSIECNNNVNDKISLSVGLISIDEVTFATGTSSSNSSSYLVTKSPYWTLSPSFSGGSNAYVALVFGSGVIYSETVGDGLGVRPSLSLKSSTLFSEGNGSIGTPYKVD